MTTRTARKMVSEPQTPEDQGDGSISRWLGQLTEGDASQAQQGLWERYFDRLAGVARRHLLGNSRRAMDEEDVALSVLESFFEGARKGRYPQLRDRTHLWPLLATIAARKAIKQSQHERAQKRGGGEVRGDSALSEAIEQAAQRSFNDLNASEPTAETVVELKELVDGLLEKLENESLRLVARRKLEGFHNSEIAQRMGVSQRTVERKLLRIRSLWSMEFPTDG
jgi:RNA polymerase sigma factor (sigma-70 family)